MTLSEFNSEFDILYNNLMSNAAPGLNAYEKSVLLTKAQTETIKDYFSPNSNADKLGFDMSEIRQNDFNYLVKAESILYDDSENSEWNKSIVKYDNRSNIYKIPSDILIILNEQIVDKDNNIYNVTPIHYMEYHRLMLKPYKYPKKNEAWRLTNESNRVEIIGPKGTYKIRYVKIPRPIILEDIYEYGTINGLFKPSECECPKGLHLEILNRAVLLAKGIWSGVSNSSSNSNAQSEGGQ